MHRSVFSSPPTLAEIKVRQSTEIAAAEQRLAVIDEYTATTALQLIGLCLNDFPSIPKEKLITEVVNWRMWIAHTESRIEARVLSHPSAAVTPHTTCDEDVYVLLCQNSNPSLASWLARAGYSKELPLWLIEGKPRRPLLQTVRIENYEPRR